MKILVVEPDLFDSGAPRVNLARADRWRAAGHDVTLFVIDPHQTDTDVEPPAGLRVTYGTRRQLRPRVRLVLTVLQLAAMALRHDVVVVGREVGDSLLCGTAAARVARRPVAVTVHARVDRALESYVRPRQRSINRRALRAVDRAVCVSAGLVPGLVDLGLPEDRTRVAVNGVDVDGVRRWGQQQPEIELPTDRPFLVGSGRLHAQKGFDVLVRAHAYALSIGAPDHDVLVLGTGAEQPLLLQLAQHLGVGDSVRLPGFLQNPHAVVSRSDLFVLPSRFEGYPLALVEALVLGVPSVATDIVSGPREVLDGSEYGELVPAEDPEALGEAIAKHLHAPEVLRDRARAGAAVARRRHDPQVSADRHLQVLRELVAER